MFKRILIANRGEIALRIIRACREMGIETVAIYSEADRGSAYLDLADEAYCVGPAKSAHSYLKIDRVISAAEVGNVEAIHRWCEERDVSFVLVILPRYYQYDEREAPNSWERDLYTVMGPYALEPFRFFEEYASGVDYPIVPLLEAFAGKEAFPTCFEGDPHWNPATPEGVTDEQIEAIFTALPEGEEWTPLN